MKKYYYIICKFKKLNLINKNTLVLTNLKTLNAINKIYDIKILRNYLAVLNFLSFIYLLKYNIFCILIRKRMIEIIIIIIILNNVIRIILNIYYFK